MSACVAWTCWPQHYLKTIFGPVPRDANLSSKFLSGQLDNFLALYGQCPDNWTIFKFLVNRLSTK